MGIDATRTKWGKMPIPGSTNYLLYFLTFAETTDLVTVVLVNTNILRFNLASMINLLLRVVTTMPNEGTSCLPSHNFLPLMPWIQIKEDK